MASYFLVFVMYWCTNMAVAQYSSWLFAGDNLAYHKPTMQDPNGWGNSSNAVDGYTGTRTGTRDNFACTQTKDENYYHEAIWSVDLGSSIFITAIKIFNRDDSGKTLNKFSIIGYNDNTNTSVILYDDTAYNKWTSIEIAITLDCKYVYRNISVKIPSNNMGRYDGQTILNLCEVQIYGGTCQRPEYPDYPVRQAQNTSKAAYNINDVIKFSCKNGYNSENAPTYICRASGLWNETFTNCRNIICKYPDIITDGYYINFNTSLKYEQGDAFFNTIIQPKCNHGYNLDGPGSRNCQEDGSWSGNGPLCKPPMCSHPGNIINGTYIFTNGSTYYGYLTYGTTITVKCVLGYNHTYGSDSRTCTMNSLWNGIDPICSPVTCNSLPNFENGDYAPSFQNQTKPNFYKNTVEAVCDKMYRLRVSPSIRQCTENGTWDGLTPICDVITTQNQQKLAIIAGAAGGGVGAILIAAIIIGVFCYRQRISKTSTKNTKSYADLQDTEKEQRVYENISSNGVPNRNSGKNDTSSSSQQESHQPEEDISPVFENDNECEETDNAPNGKNNIFPVYAVVSPKKDQRSKVISRENVKSEPVSPTYVSGEGYVNISKVTVDKIPKTAIMIDRLSDVVLNEHNAMEKFNKEFQSLPIGLLEAHTEALRPENRHKNKYKKLYPYDKTRVVLQIENDDHQSDYINACYIKGFDGTCAYVASQGPYKDSKIDFWRMIWQLDCGKIVMLTNIVENNMTICEQYWPNEGNETFGNITITLQDTECFCDFVTRTLTLKKNSKTKQVIQFHFTSWPDKGVPKYVSSLVHFRSRVKSTQAHGKGPMVVHCSAGIGRTGTFIALDYLTDEGKALKYVDVFGCVQTLRWQRTNLVQTLDQYIFVHQALVESLALCSSGIPAAEFENFYRELLQIDSVKRKRKIDAEFEIMTKMSPKTEESQYASAKLVANRNKNRYSNVLPATECMPVLLSGSEACGGYINAVFLPNYKEKKGFIITQSPLESTKDDFWNLVYDYDVYTIVMMNDVSELKKEEIYWPSKEESLSFGHIIVTFLESENLGGHTIMCLELTKFKKTKKVKIIQCGHWAVKNNTPDSPSSVFTILEIVQDWQQKTGNKPVVVHCMNGANKSGLFCVISAVIERLKIEQDVGISQVIQKMRNCREQIIPTVEQFQFCHEAVKEYIKLLETYSNFTIFEHPTVAYRI